MTLSRNRKDLIAEARATEEALRDLWSAMANRLSPSETLSDRMFGQTENVRKVALIAGRTVKANPLPSALVAAGLAWFVFGRSKAKPGAALEDLTRWEDEGGLPAPIAEKAASWRDMAEVARTRAQYRLEALMAAGEEALSDGVDKVETRALDAAAFARHKATITADLARDLSKAFRHGLSNVGSEAEARIIKAREQAFDAFDTVQSTVKTEAPKIVARHPYTTAAVTAALGAGLFAALPRHRGKLLALLPLADLLLRRGKDSSADKSDSSTAELADAIAARLADLQPNAGSAKRASAATRKKAMPKPAAASTNVTATKRKTSAAKPRSAKPATTTATAEDDARTNGPLTH